MERADDQVSEKREQSAAATLIDLACKNSNDGRRRLFDYERKIFDESFEIIQASRKAAIYHVDAIRSAIKSRNEEILHILLQRDATHEILRHGPDILQVAIKTRGEYPYRLPIEEPSLLDRIKYFISYGALIDSLDEGGRTPVYYACVYGQHECFEYLVKNGAGFNDLYKHQSNMGLYGPPDPATTPEPDRANLLQVTLDARIKNELRWRPDDMQPPCDLKRWGDIITFFLDAGLRVRPDDSSLVRFFNVSCFRGKSEYVHKVLSHAIDINAGAVHAHHQDCALLSPLHMAAVGGQKEIAAVLLTNGADPRKEYTYIDSLMGRRSELFTPIKYAMKPLMRFHDSGSANVRRLEACEVLLEASANDEDRRLVLERCAVDGQIEILKRLLSSKFPGMAVPFSEHTDALQLLVDYGASIDVDGFLKMAIQRQSTATVDFLSEIYPSDIRIQEAMMEILVSLLRSHDGFQKFEISFTQNENLIESQSSLDRLLKAACLGEQVDAVHLLLRRGADPKLPTYPQTASFLLQKNLRSRSLEGVMQSKHIRIFQMLHVYSNDKEKAGGFDFEKVWMSPSQLPPECRTKEAKEGICWWREESVGRSRETTPTSKAENPIQPDPIQPNSTQLNPKPKNPGPRIVSAEAPEELYRFEKLDGLSTIRLAILQPSKNMNSPIRCRLTTTSIAQSPDYDSISYVRGLTSDKTYILVDDKRLLVPTSLWSALYRLRQTEETCTLWADAICINEEDMTERNQQVSMMRDIYQTSKTLRIWTGEDEENSHYIFEHLDAWKRHYEDVMAGREPSDAHGSHVNPPHYEGPTRQAYLKFCFRPWFFRTWALQESSLCKNSVVMCGPYSEKLKLLCRPSSFYDRDYDPLRGIDGPTHLMQMSSHRKNPGWKSVLQCNKLNHATDPKDKIYGLLGLFAHPLISVDYSLSVEDVYTKFTAALLKEKRSAQVFHWFGTQRQLSTLPSWVPDYSVTLPTGILPRNTGSYTIHGVFPNNRVPKLRFSDLNPVFWGFYLETVQAVGDELVADPVMCPGSEDFKRVMLQWETLAADMAVKRFTQPIACAFLDTLIAHSPGIGELSNKPKPRLSGAFQISFFSRWYDKFGTGPLKARCPEFFEEMKIMEEWWGPNPDRVHGWPDRLNHDIAPVSYGRKFFTTDKGSIGIGPPRTRVGDMIVYFPGGLYPFVVRPRGDGAYTLAGDCYLYDFDEYILITDESAEAKEYTLK